MNASQLFNSVAKRSNSNFSKSGNYVRSTQPGKPFASTEALNYIPVGYNKSGGDMFRYGSVALLKEFLQEGAIKGVKGSALGDTSGGIFKNFLSLGFERDTAKAQAIRLNRLRQTKGLDAAQNEFYRMQKNTGFIRDQDYAYQGFNTPYGHGGSLAAEAAEYKRVARSKNSRVQSRGFQLALPEVAGATESPATIRAAREAGEIRTARLRKAKAKLESNRNLATMRDEMKNANQGRHVTTHFQSKREAKNARKRKRAAEWQQARDAWKTATTTTVGNQQAKLGTPNWMQGWSALSSSQKWKLGGAGAIAGIVAAGTTLGAISGSKDSPLRSGIMMAGTAAGLAVGAKFASQAVLKRMAIKNGVKGSMVGHSFNKAAYSSMMKMGSMGAGQIGGLALGAGVIGLGMGVGRRTTGI